MSFDVESIPIGPVGINPIVKFRIGFDYYEMTLLYTTKDNYCHRLYYWNDDKARI